jgi:hypothetical protein
MANVAVAFGFKHIGYAGGAAPTYVMKRRKIALGNGHAIFHGDPVISLGTGYIDQAANNSTQFAGIFQGCEYLSVSQGRKVRSNYWPGSDASADVDAFIIDSGDALFLGASNGAPIVFGNVNNNIGYFIATGGSAAPVIGSGQGSTSAQLSGALFDVAGTNSGGSGAINTTSTLPFRIVGLYSDFVAQGAPTAGSTSFNGSDNTTNFNWAVVKLNNVDFNSLTGI